LSCELSRCACCRSRNFGSDDSSEFVLGALRDPCQRFDCTDACCRHHSWHLVCGYLCRLYTHPDSEVREGSFERCWLSEQAGWRNRKKPSSSRIGRFAIPWTLSSRSNIRHNYGWNLLGPVHSDRVRRHWGSGRFADSSS